MVAVARPSLGWCRRSAASMVSAGTFTWDMGHLGHWRHDPSPHVGMATRSCLRPNGIRLKSSGDAPNDSDTSDFDRMSCGRGDQMPISVARDQWVLGFVTAERWFSKTKRYKDPDNAALVAWISNYCSKAPLDQLSLAAYLLTFELRNDPAESERFATGLRKVIEQRCTNGDKEACKFLRQAR
jgi:hypothetical protein